MTDKELKDLEKLANKRKKKKVKQKDTYIELEREINKFYFLERTM